MNDGQTQSPAVSQPTPEPSTPEVLVPPTPVAEALPPGVVSAPNSGPQAPAAMPAQSNYKLPPPTQQMVRAVDSESQQIFAALGRMEADYVVMKGRLLADLDRNRQKRQQVLDGAARSLGIDIDNSKWNFDQTTMTITRAN